MQDFYSGLLGGFQQRQDQVEAQTRQDAEASRQRERSVYSTLLQSDDPEIQHLALTGILDSAATGKKKKGMAGWLGELEQAPAFGAIRSLLDSPAFKSSTKESLPSTQYADSPKLPGGTPPPALNQTADPSAPLAQPNTALTQQQPGGPNPPPVPSSQQGPADQSAGDQAQQQATLGVPPEVQQQAAGLAQADALQALPDVAATFIHEQTPQVQTGGQDSPLTFGPPKPRGVATSQPNYGLRPDGTPKGNGFLGPLQIPGTNSVASEYSIANSEQLKDANGNYLDYPSLVPTLTPEEVQQVLIAARDHQPVPASVEQKAEAFALQRKAQGLPLFAQPGEEQGRGGPPAPRGVASPSQTYEVPAARRVFLSPIEKYKQEQIAKGAADIEGDVSAYMSLGMGRDEALAQVKAERLRRAGGSAGAYQSIAGEIPDGQGGWQPVNAIFDRQAGAYVNPDTRQPLPGFRGRTATNSQSWGVELEPLAMAIFGKRGPQLDQTQAATLLEAKQQQKNQLTTVQALAAASRMLPNATLDQQMHLAEYMRQGTQVNLPGGQQASSGSSTGAPPAPSAAAPVSGANPQGPASAAAPPPARTLTPPPGMADATKLTGAPLAPAVQASLSKAHATNDLIDQAIAALTPYKDDDTLQGSLTLADKYRGGQYDPVATAAAQLADLAGLQNSAQASLTSGASRALQYYTDRRQHVPRLPSGRQTLANGVLPAGAVQTGSILLKGDEAGFDSPKLMYQKLVGAKANNLNFIKEVEGATKLQQNPIGATGAPPAPAGTPAPVATPTSYQDAQGQWHIRLP